MITQARNLIESLLAVAGVWLMVREVPDYATSWYLSATDDSPVSAAGPSVLATQSFHFLVSAAAGLALILARKVLARWIQTESATTRLGAEPLLAAGIAVVGVYYVVSGLSVLGQLIAAGAIVGSQPYALWSSIISILLGLSLFAGAPWVVRLWRRLSGE